MINGRQPSSDGTSGMNREVHMRYDGLGVKLLGPAQRMHCHVDLTAALRSREPVRRRMPTDWLFTLASCNLSWRPLQEHLVPPDSSATRAAIVAIIDLTADRC